MVCSTPLSSVVTAANREPRPRRNQRIWHSGAGASTLVRAVSRSTAPLREGTRRSELGGECSLVVVGLACGFGADAGAGADARLARGFGEAAGARGVPGLAAGFGADAPAGGVCAREAPGDFRSGWRG
jgi:hypothetical protein